MLLAFSKKPRSFTVSSLVFFQVMKPTRTFSETFHIWPQTIPRSWDAAAWTPNPNQQRGLPRPSHLDSTCFHAGTEAFQLSGMQTRAPPGCPPFVQSQLSWCCLESPHTGNSLCEHCVSLNQLYEASMRCEEPNIAMPNKTCKSFFFLFKKRYFYDILLSKLSL